MHNIRRPKAKRTKDPFLLFVLIAGLGLMQAGRARADGDVLEIFGYVLDNFGNPVVGLDVVADDYVGGFYPSTTDADGFYDIDLDGEENYRVEVSCAQLTARGFGCLPSMAVSLSTDNLRLDFVVNPVSPLQITNTSLPKGNVGMTYSAQLGATGGNPPYDWQLALDSPGLPAGLSLNSSGLISGTPMTNAAASIKVQVTDSNSIVTNKVLSLIINPRPVLGAPIWATNLFSMRLTGASNQNYTIQMNTNLSSAHWTSLFVTNNLNAGSYIVSDPHATNQQRFYRVLIGP